YIEASKESPNLGMLQYALDCILILCHPFAPFLTEAIRQELGWQKRLLMLSRWPENTDFDGKQAKAFEELITVVTEARTLVSAMKLKQPALLHQSDLLTDHAKTIARMARLGAVERTEQDKGLTGPQGYKLADTNLDVWLDVSEAELAHYKDDLHAQLVATK